MTALIALDNIAYHRSGRDILHDISFQIDPAKILTVIGPNGAGKSTLLALILGNLQPSRGKITRQKGLKISVVPQKFHTPPDLPITARRFLQDIPEATKSPWLERLNITQRLDRPLQNLSGGEMQRLLLARAILRQPQLMVLDEPAAGIDPVAMGDFYQLIRDWQQEQGAAILMVSHDLHLVMAASDVVLCLNQHICCQGHPEEITKHPEFIRLLGTLNAESIGIYTHHHNHQHL